VDVTLFTNLLGAIGLGAASGLNPWIPLLGLGVAQRSGVVELSTSFDWLGATPTLVVLGVLFVLDLIGDKVAAIDSVLHVVGLVVAPVSGAIVLSAQENLLSDSHPLLAGGLGVVLGGTVQVARGTLRPAVTATTGGLGNPVISAIEDAVSTVLTVLAVLVPVLAFLALVGLVVWAVLLVRRWRLRRRPGGSPRSPVPEPPGWP
jgi:hypothetical protein